MQDSPAITSETALFLDFDGTLVDIAPHPDEVQVNAQVLQALPLLSRQLDGALAIVSGRRMADLDHFLAPLTMTCAAEHGARIRWPDGQVQPLAAPDLVSVQAAMQSLVDAHPALHLEIKQAAVALHYRQAPELQALCEARLQDALAPLTGLDLMRGKCVFEVKAGDVHKGSAIALLMQRAPFAGRKPLFVGDDVTDEDGFATVRQLGGQGIKVGPGESQALHRLANPQAVWAWLMKGTSP